MISKSKVVRAIGGLALGLALAACTSSGGSTTPQGQTVKISALDTFKYDPATLTAKVGQAVTVTIDNKGVLDHSFVIDELGAKLEGVKSGASAQVTFTALSAGTYIYYCDVAGHKAAGMTGTLTVNP